MRVPYIDLKRQFRDEALRQAVRAELEDCRFVLGPTVARFERRFAALCGVSRAVALNSGTDAIFLALKALGIGPGDEVITVPNSFVATAGAIAAAGARPVFVDVGADYNMDPGAVSAAVTPRTRALLPVHLTGNPADMEAISAVARDRGLFVVEDAAQAAGATLNGRPVGAFGTAGCFSLHPLKNLNVCGDGGALVTDADAVGERVARLRNHGLVNRDEIDGFGYNSRMDAIQAAVALQVMEGLDAVSAKRRRNAAFYREGLADLEGRLTLPVETRGARPVYHTFVVQARRRDELAAFLLSRGVETKIHYPVPIHLQKPCREMGYGKGDFPVAEAQAARILSLPVHQHLEEDQLGYVCDRIREFYDTR